jgi:hypothetical protein
MRCSIFSVALVGAVLCGITSSAEIPASLDAGWQNPPDEARLRAYWWWLNGNVTSNSITRDLEAMRAQGFGGALICDANGASQDGNAKVPHGPTFFSPEWRDLYRHALATAERLGLTLGLNIQSGWNLGGPNVSQEDAAKKYVWSEQRLSGGVTVSVKLPAPPARDGFYRDIAVLAYRLNQFPSNAITFTASSSQPAHQPGWAGDGNPATFWVSQGTEAGQGPTRQHPEWLQATLQRPAVLSGFKIQGRNHYGPRDGELLVSTNGSDFFPVKPFTLEDGRELSVQFDPVNARAVRLRFFDAYDPVHSDAPRNVQVAEWQFPEIANRAGDAIRPLENWKQKALQESLQPFSAPDSSPLFAEYPSAPDEADAAVTDVVDLTAHLSPDGTLNWSAPAGEWQILRFGCTIGDHAYVSTSSDGWQGYAIDVYSARAFQHYWDAVVEPLIADAGPLAGKTLKYLHTDSWEVELANWTPDLREQFQRYRGYDMTPWLPVLAGRIINSREASDRFLFDYRKTLGDLAIDGHYRLFRENARRHGLLIHPESGGPHAVPIDAQRCLGWGDVPMSEFWAWSWTHRIGDPNRFFVKQPAGAAHTYGHNLVFAEGFTTIGPHWQERLWNNLKPAFDKALCEGLNVLVWHAFVCSPASEGIPGQQYFAGTHLNPNVTWWSRSAPFFRYLNRCQWMLQQGRFAADVLYYYGDHVPNFAQLKASDPARVLPGYDYDVITAEALINRASVKDGKIVLADGMTYRLLVLPDRDQLALPVLEKVRELVAAGATVIGPKPARGESLAGQPAADARIKTLAAELWDGRTGPGRVITGQTARQVLFADGVPPDCEFLSADGGQMTRDLDYIHRTAGDSEIYFVINRSTNTLDLNCAFRVAGKAPELWNAVTGEHAPAAAYTETGQRTFVPLRFPPCGSWFVVFREPAAAHPARADANEVKLKALADIAGRWTVHFDPRWGGPEAADFDSLASWTERPEPGIKYYSGTATYEKSFVVPVAPDSTGRRPLFLDLGDVRELAEVKVNGESCGIVWCPPWRVDVTGAVKTGENKLEVKVVNFWPNRIIGDQSLPPDRRFTRTNIRKLTAQVPLMPSGLLGPVRLFQAEPQTERTRTERGF